jgi:hypothetical protein
MIFHLSKDCPSRKSPGFTPDILSAVRGAPERDHSFLSLLLQLTVKTKPTPSENLHDGALNCEDV